MLNFFLWGGDNYEVFDLTTKYLGPLRKARGRKYKKIELLFAKTFACCLYTFTRNAIDSGKNIIKNKNMMGNNTYADIASKNPHLSKLTNSLPLS